MNLIIFAVLFLLSCGLISCEENQTEVKSSTESRIKLQLISKTESNEVDSSGLGEKSKTKSAVIDQRILQRGKEGRTTMPSGLKNVLNCGLQSNGDAPWIAVIEHKDPTGRDRRKTLSKGVLISNLHILTTVSSVHNTHPFWIVSRVRLGDVPTWINEDVPRDHSNIVSMEVEHVYQHKNKDIAVIKLKHPVEYSDAIQPACLPITPNYNFPELFLHICKRIRDHKGKRHVELVSSKPLAPDVCSTMFHKKGAEFGEDQFCAWDEYGDTCTGDVGGPLFAKFYGRYMVVGLNSYALAEDEFDATDYPGVYVNVGQFLNWINGIITRVN